MNHVELAEIINDYPCVYHMSKKGSWASIRKHGLLSTSAILDLAGIQGEERHEIEACRRLESKSIRLDDFTSFTIRDNKPMTERSLSKCLLDGLSPEDWYKILNRRVFFWFSKERLKKLQCAQAYRNECHEIFEIDSGALISAYRNKITLSPINSGATLYVPQNRGNSTFLSIENYPYDFWKQKRKYSSTESVVELTIEDGVPDIEKYVTRALLMENGIVLKCIYQR